MLLSESRIQRDELTTPFSGQLCQPGIRHLPVTADAFRFHFLIAEAIIPKFMSAYLP